ncbi:MAG: LysR family transcriptional regulator [Cocleimonas sp.]
MEIRQLRTLVCILDFGGFAAAGEALGLTQSAVSLQIKALEQEFGEHLFDRSKRPPRPTSRAITLARKSREILRMCNDLNSASDEQVSGSLQLGAVPSVQRMLLPQALTDLRQTNPDLFISVHTGLSEELTRSVYRGILDAAVVSEPRELPMGMSWYPFASESLVVISHKKAKGKSVKDILETNPYIQFKRTSSAGELIEAELTQLGINTKTVLETDNFDSIWQMVSCGMGVAVMPQHIADDDVSNPNSPSTLSNSDGYNPHDKLKPRNIITRQLREPSETPVKLITGLVKRTADPKGHLISALLETLKY